MSIIQPLAFSPDQNARQLSPRINSSGKSQPHVTANPDLSNLIPDYSTNKKLQIFTYSCQKATIPNSRHSSQLSLQSSIQVEVLDTSVSDCQGSNADMSNVAKGPHETIKIGQHPDNLYNSSSQPCQSTTHEQRQPSVCLAQKRHTSLIKILQMYDGDKESSEHLGHYWAEILPYCISNYLDLPSVLELRRACKRLYYDRRYAVSNISFNLWSTLTEKEIISVVLPQFRTFLTAGSFAQLNFSQCCLLTDSFPKALIQYDQQKLCRFIKALIFDFCYALSDKSLGILFSTSLPNIEALSLRCARSRDLTGSPFSTHLSKANWPKFHQLSCSCTQITLSHVDAAARYITERAIELGTSPKLGLAGSSASFSLIQRLRLEKEHQEFLDAIIHTRSVEKAEVAIKAFESQWSKALEEPEHKGRVLHRLVRNRAAAILVNAPYSVAIIYDSDDNLKWIVTEDQRATALWKNPAPSAQPSAYSTNNAQFSDVKALNVTESTDYTSKKTNYPNANFGRKETKSANSNKLAFTSLQSPNQTKQSESPENLIQEQNTPEASSISDSGPQNEEYCTETVRDSNAPEQTLIRLMSKSETLSDESTHYSRWMYPLPLAIRTRNLAMVKFLVENGAYVDVWGYNFATPLYIACSTEHIEAKESLLQKSVCSFPVPDMIRSECPVSLPPKAEKNTQTPMHTLVDPVSQLQNSGVDQFSPLSRNHNAVRNENYTLSHKTGLSSDSEAPTLTSVIYGMHNPDDYDEQFPFEHRSFYNSTSSVATTVHENDALSRQSSCAPDINLTNGAATSKDQQSASNKSSSIVPKFINVYNSEQGGSESVPEHNSAESLPQPPGDDLIHRQFTFGIGLMPVPAASSIHEEVLVNQSNNHNMRSNSNHSQEDRYFPQSDHSIVKYLLDHGAPVDPPDLYSNKCPVNAAIKHHNIVLLESLIQKGARLNVRSLPPESISTVIQHSRRHQQRKHAQKSQFCRLNYKSPLFWACEVEAWDCVKLLLECGANPHWRDPFSHRSLTPILLAYRRNPEILHLFLRHGAGATKETCWVLSEVLGAAILYDDLKTAEFLVTTNAELLEQGSNCMWSLPLIQASRLDKIQTVQLLLKLGADPNAVNQEGLTSLHLAANEGRKAIAECLLEHGALPNIKGGIYGKTPLHIAVEENFPNLVLILLNHGALITMKDNAGHTPLMTAIAARNDKVALLLVETAQADDLNTLDSAGRSALMYAIYFGQFKVASALVEKGVSCKVVDPSGASAESLLKAKINSFGKTTSALNKFFRNIVGAQQPDQGSLSCKIKETGDGHVGNSFFDRYQNMSSATVEELNIKRKKTAQALLKKIQTASSKKHSIPKQASPSPTIAVQQADKIDIVKDSKKTIQPHTVAEEKVTGPEDRLQESADVPSIKKVEQFPEWDFYGFGDDYDLGSDTSVSDLSDLSTTNKN